MSFSIDAATDSQLLSKLDIQRALFSDDYESFDVDNQQTLYILQESTTAITKGVAVMIGESSIPVVGKQGLIPLATELNNVGWVTLILPAPDIAFTVTNTPKPEAASVEANEQQTQDEQEPAANNIMQVPPEESQLPSVIEDTDLNKSHVSKLDTVAFLQHEERLISLLKASAGKAQEYPGFFLVIGQGSTAAWMTKIYAEKKVDIPDALVVIGPYWPDRNVNRLLPQWIAQTPMPLLDIYSDGDNKWAKKTVSQRKTSVTKALKLHYRQRMLVGVDPQLQPSTYLSKEIYGWLSHMGW